MNDDWFDDWFFPRLLLFMAGFVLGMWLAGGYA